MIIRREDKVVFGVRREEPGHLRFSSFDARALTHPVDRFIEAWYLKQIALMAVADEAGHEIVVQGPLQRVRS